MIKCVLGVDFDNTLVSYDNIMYRTAKNWGVITEATLKTKRNIRDDIRRLPNGEAEWQKLQSFVYGKAMDEAILINGVQEFFQLCREEGVKVSIVSHKTERAAMDSENINLRSVALDWMEQNGFFDRTFLGLKPEDVYFESTRAEKIKRIIDLGCTHFIDDLMETFLDEAFLNTIEKMLYDPHKQYVSIGPIKVFSSWKEIVQYFSGKVVLLDKQRGFS